MADNNKALAEDAPVVTLRAPVDVVAAVPYLLGFHPEHSLVVMGLRGPRRRIGLTMRADLPPGEYAAAAARQLVRRLAANDTAAAIVALYAPDQYPHHALWLALRTALDAARIDVRESLRVDDGRWWSYLCTEPACCPADGTPIVPATSPGGPARVAAAMVHAGMVALPDRAALAATLRPVTGLARLAMAQAVDRAEIEALRGPRDRAGIAAARVAAVRRLDDAVRAREHGERPALADDDAARMLVALAHLPIRDAAAEWVEGERGEAAIALWTELVRRASPPYDVAPATLLGWAAWRSGDGGLARIAIDRALASDPAYRLARLVEHALDAGIDPAVMHRPPAKFKPRRGRTER